MTYCSVTAMPYITRRQEKDGQKACQKGDLGIAKNYQDITLTSIVAKAFNALLLNHIKLELEKICRFLLSI